MISRWARRAREQAFREAMYTPSNCILMPRKYSPVILLPVRTTRRAPRADRDPHEMGRYLMAMREHHARATRVDRHRVS